MEEVGTQYSVLSTQYSVLSSLRKGAARWEWLRQVFLAGRRTVAPRRWGRVELWLSR